MHIGKIGFSTKNGVKNDNLIFVNDNNNNNNENYNNDNDNNNNNNNKRTVKL